MRVLAIETATSACSVALLDGEDIIDFAHEIVGRGHAERLLPMIAGLSDGGRANAIRVDVGPGSFTGIRVGIAAARALAFGWSIPAGGFTSLALIAAIDGWQADTLVAIEGGHGEVFVAQYDEHGAVISPLRSLSFADACASVSETRIVGNAGARLVAARGWGKGVDITPDARATNAIIADLPAYSPCEPALGCKLMPA